MRLKKLKPEENVKKISRPELEFLKTLVILGAL